MGFPKLLIESDVEERNRRVTNEYTKIIELCEPNI